MAAFGVFGLCQIHAFVDYLRSKLNAQQFEILFKSVISLVGFVLLSVGAVLMLTGKDTTRLVFTFAQCVYLRLQHRMETLNVANKFVFNLVYYSGAETAYRKTKIHKIYVY